MANRTKKSGKKYTRAQRKAYYSGMGYRAAYEGKEIPFRNAQNRASFQAGWKAAMDTVKKYPDLKKK